MQNKAPIQSHDIFLSCDNPIKIKVKQIIKSNLQQKQCQMTKLKKKSNDKKKLTLKSNF